MLLLLQKYAFFAKIASIIFDNPQINSKWQNIVRGVFRYFLKKREKHFAIRKESFYLCAPFWGKREN